VLERLRGVFTARRYTNPRLPLAYLYLRVRGGKLSPHLTCWPPSQYLAHPHQVIWLCKIVWNTSMHPFHGKIKNTPSPGHPSSRLPVPRSPITNWAHASCDHGAYNRQIQSHHVILVWIKIDWLVEQLAVKLLRCIIVNFPLCN